jgi:hypothetical protein
VAVELRTAGNGCVNHSADPLVTLDDGSASVVATIQPCVIPSLWQASMDDLFARRQQFGNVLGHTFDVLLTKAAEVHDNGDIRQQRVLFRIDGCLPEPTSDSQLLSSLKRQMNS